MEAKDRIKLASRWFGYTDLMKTKAGNLVGRPPGQANRARVKIPNVTDPDFLTRILEATRRKTTREQILWAKHVQARLGGVPYQVALIQLTPKVAAGAALDAVEGIGWEEMEADLRKVGLI